MRHLIKLMAAIGLALSSSWTLSAPLELSGTELDGITAGSADYRRNVNASGGAIVGNNSSAVLSLTGTVDLDSNAQSGARALNLVNSSESTVANGVNVWDGRLGTSGEFDGGAFHVEQSNNIAQEQRRVALLPEYERPEANTQESFSGSGASSSSSTLSQLDDLKNVHSMSSMRETTTQGSVDTESAVLGQTVKGGRGLAGSGEINVLFDGGDIAFTASGDFGGGLIGVDLGLTIGLPEFEVGISGSGCAVQAGSCSANGTTSETSSEMTDNSSLARLDTSESSSEQFAKQGAKTFRSPFELEDAQAEYIVVDDSQIQVSSLYTVSLTGAAQQNMRGLNVVNAAGSAVANGVNVARTSSGMLTANGDLLHLSQSNVIVHSR